MPLVTDDANNVTTSSSHVAIVKCFASSSKQTSSSSNNSESSGTASIAFALNKPCYTQGISSLKCLKKGWLDVPLK